MNKPIVLLRSGYKLLMNHKLQTIHLLKYLNLQNEKHKTPHGRLGIMWQEFIIILHVYIFVLLSVIQWSSHDNYWPIRGNKKQQTNYQNTRHVGEYIRKFWLYVT